MDVPAPEERAFVKCTEKFELLSRVEKDCLDASSSRPNLSFPQLLAIADELYEMRGERKRRGRRRIQAGNESQTLD